MFCAATAFFSFALARRRAALFLIFFAPLVMKYPFVRETGEVATSAIVPDARQLSRAAANRDFLFRKRTSTNDITNSIHRGLGVDLCL